MRTASIFFSFCGYLFPAMAADVPWRAIANYIDLSYAAQAQTMAADNAGDLFIVSNVTEPSGRPQIRVTKTDQSGVTLANIDFGGSVSLLDIIAGVAIDPQGNVVITGTTSSPDFPLVSPLISKTALCLMLT